MTSVGTREGSAVRTSVGRGAVTGGLDDCKTFDRKSGRQHFELVYAISQHATPSPFTPSLQHASHGYDGSKQWVSSAHDGSSVTDVTTETAKGTLVGTLVGAELASDGAADGSTVGANVLVGCSVRGM